PALADALTPSAVQNAQPDPTFDLPQRAGQRLLDVMQSHFQVDERLKQPAPAVNALSLLTSLQKVGGDVRTQAIDLSQHIRLLNVVAPTVVVAPQPRFDRIVRLAPVAAASSDVTVEALAPIALDLVSPSWPGTPERSALTVERPTLLQALDPGVTFTNR